MSDLETFRDHARHMAGAEHKPDCSGRNRFGDTIRPEPTCDGCVTSTDRSLWTRLADEADAWLNSQSEEALPL
jgi:hypothetical protein